MNQLQVFNFQENIIRTVVVNGEPWWVLKDVCDVLEIKNYRDTLNRLNDSMKGVATTDTLGGEQTTSIISEAGVYKLVFTSRKPEAEKFTDWLAMEVIPSIREHGLYAKEELLDDPELLLEVVIRLKGEREKRLEAESKCQVFAEIIEYKNEVIEGLVDTVDIYTKRTVLNRVVRHGGANFQHRYRELYKVFREMNGVDLQARCEGYNTRQELKKNQLSVIKYAEKFGFLDALYKAAVKLYETDVNEILESIRRVR